MDSHGAKVFHNCIKKILTFDVDILLVLAECCCGDLVMVTFVHQNGE